MNATNIVALSNPQKRSGCKLRPRVRAFATLKSAGLVEDTAIRVELEGGGMGLNKYEKPGRTRLPGGVGRIGDAKRNWQAEGRNTGVGLNAQLGLNAPSVVPIVIGVVLGLIPSGRQVETTPGNQQLPASLPQRLWARRPGRWVSRLGHAVGNALLYAGPAASIQRAKGSQAAGMSLEAHATRDGLDSGWWSGER